MSTSRFQPFGVSCVSPARLETGVAVATIICTCRVSRALALRPAMWSPDSEREGDTFGPERAGRPDGDPVAQRCGDGSRNTSGD